MDIDVFSRSLLERAWQTDRARFSPAAEDPPLCLRCGRPLAARLAENLPGCRACRPGGAPPESRRPLTSTAGPTG